MTGTPTFSHGKGRHMHLHQRCGTTGKVSEWEYPGVTPNQSNTAESGAVNGTTVPTRHEIVLYRILRHSFFTKSYHPKAYTATAATAATA